MTQTKEEKGVLRAFWEGFKEGWNGSSAQEEAPSLAREEVIEAADEWDIDDMPETVVAAESIEPEDEWDMPETVMAVEAPQEKRGLAAFFGGFCEGFKEGWNNPPAYGNGSNKTVYDDEDWDIGAQNIFSCPQYRVTYDPVYGSSDAMGMNHESGRAVYIYEDEY